MRWRGQRRSVFIEDRRGAGGTTMGRAVRTGGIGGLGLVAIVVLSLLFGVDPRMLLEEMSQGAPPGQVTRQAGPAGGASDDMKAFASVVLADTEDTWTPLFDGMGLEYRPATLVLFDGAVRSACGTASAAVGPFYCPGDRQVYLDLSFFQELEHRFGAPGDFARAYVIAHEIGHHVQTLLGVTGRVAEARAGLSATDANALSVRVELQADCFAGVWAHHAERSRDLLEAGDVEEGLGAAAAIGDDRLQRRSQGVVVPDSFTHGTSAQRVRWFRRGLDDGTVAGCDTFSVAEP